MIKKYIDVEKLKAEIERRIKELTHDKYISVGSKTVRIAELHCIDKCIDSLPQEQLEVNLEEFTEKMDAWKARFNHPDDIPIKATMAFTARMFYMYPNVAREWYESLPKVTQD